MRLRFLLFLLLVTLYSHAAATTAPDLRSRITIDGNVADYVGDEIVLDATTSVVETADDSRWGSDNDLAAVALTWDNYNLYVAVSAVIVSTELMVFLDTSCDGYSNMNDAPDFRRNIELGTMGANAILRARRGLDRVEAGFRDCETPYIRLAPDAFEGVLSQAGADSGALEVALPWERLGPFARVAGAVQVPRGQSLRLLAAVTGGVATGAGDAGPNGSVVLERDSSRVAILDRHIELPLDADGDGVLDIGVSPRAVAIYTGTAPAAPLRRQLPLEIVLDRRAFAPDDGETLPYRIRLTSPDYTNPVYLSASVYSAAGRLLRKLLVEEPLVLSGSGAMEEWDGRDDGGAVVPGGIYVIAVSGGVAPGAAKETVKAAVSVVR